MRETANAIRVMEELRHDGVRFSIDDFGTGYSSLAQLKRLPVDEIKIDKSFIVDLKRQTDDEVIVRSTIELGHSLGVKVVAEGVETADGWEMLRQMGCDLAQRLLHQRTASGRADRQLGARTQLQTRNGRDSDSASAHPQGASSQQRLAGVAPQGE